MNEIVTYPYGNATLEAINTDSGVALSDEQIGIALGYADPSKAISNLVNRNADELAGLATILNLRKVEGDREVTREIRVWSEQGVMAITFLAKTPAAIAFRKWARETLYAVRYSAPVATREPLTEIDRMAGMMNQIIPAMNDRLLAVEAFQQQHDPKKIVNESAQAVIAHQKTMGEMRAQIKTLVRAVVMNAVKLSDDSHLPKGWNTYSRVYSKVHAHVGVGCLADYATVEQANAGIGLLREMLQAMGAKIPSQLRLVG